MILINFVLVEEVEEAEMEEEFDEEQVLNEVKPGDWFSVRSAKFTRKEAILLAYVCRDELVELAALPTGYISQQSYDMCLTNHSDPLFSVLHKHDWQKTTKDKLKNYVIRLRKFGVNKKFKTFIAEVQTFIDNSN